MIEVDYLLPNPTEEELNNGLRLEYFERLKDLNLDRKYKISKDQLSTWIYHNFMSMFLLNEELSLNKFKELNIK